MKKDINLKQLLKSKKAAVALVAICVAVFECLWFFGWPLLAATQAPAQRVIDSENFCVTVRGELTGGDTIYYAKKSGTYEDTTYICYTMSDGINPNKIAIVFASRPGTTYVSNDGTSFTAVSDYTVAAEFTLENWNLQFISVSFFDDAPFKDLGDTTVGTGGPGGFVTYSYRLFETTFNGAVYKAYLCANGVVESVYVVESQYAAGYVFGITETSFSLKQWFDTAWAC